MGLVVTGNEIVRQFQFYDIPYQGEHLKDLECYVAPMVETAFRKAVERQMLSDVPIGAFLSGGVDSSAVVSMMRSISPDMPIPCYTIHAPGINDEGFAEDFPYAQMVAKTFNADLRVVEVGPESVSLLPKMLFHVDEPQADPAPVNAMLIAERARADGIKVLLSGTGGDDLFAGYRRHQAIANEGMWDMLPQPVRSWLARSSRCMLGGELENRWVKHPTMRRLAKLFSAKF